MLHGRLTSTMKLYLHNKLEIEEFWVFKFLGILDAIIIFYFCLICKDFCHWNLKQKFLLNFHCLFINN